MSQFYVNRRKQQRAESIRNCIAIVVCVLLIGVGMFGTLWYHTGKDYYYHTAEGQMVDRPCEIVAINGDLITVETINGGELYEFYGDDYKIGDTIICTFNMANEIIDAE